MCEGARSFSKLIWDDAHKQSIRKVSVLLKIRQILETDTDTKQTSGVTMSNKKANKTNNKRKM